MGQVHWRVRVSVMINLIGQEELHSPSCLFALIRCSVEIERTVWRNLVCNGSMETENGEKFQRLLKSFRKKYWFFSKKAQKTKLGTLIKFLLRLERVDLHDFGRVFSFLNHPHRRKLSILFIKSFWILGLYIGTSKNSLKYEHTEELTQILKKEAFWSKYLCYY